MLLFAFSESFWDSAQDLLKTLFSAGSLVVTLYFWFVRSNRERVSLKVYPDRGFEGVLDAYGTGLWTGRLFLANLSILPTAIVAAKVELWWDGHWQPGMVHPTEGHELPWNLPPAQVFARGVIAAFDLGKDTDRDRVYANQRLRFTFVTVEGRRITEEVETGTTSAVMAAAA